jgi:hypothetical protein
MTDSPSQLLTRVNYESIDQKKFDFNINLLTLDIIKFIN